MNKILIALLILMLTASSSYAFQLFKKHDPLNPAEKSEYVNMDFWQRFNDPYLAEYICTGVKNNHDVRQASWVVEEYRQNVKYQFGQELPSLSVSANYAGLKIPKLDNFRLKTNAFILPFVLQYEPDFLLKNRDKTKSVKKAYEAQKYEEKAVYISLASDIATAYLNILQYDYLINRQEKVVSIKHEQLLREEKKFNRGVIDNAQYNSLKKEYETVKSGLNTMYKNRQTALTQLAVLIGVSPQCANDLKRGNFETFEYGCPVPSEIVSDVIFHRPDVMASEANLEKAKIDVRVARKEFLPSFNITGLWIFNTIAPGSFFSWQSSLASIFAGATQDIFMGGRKIANLKINKARYEQMFENYRQTDLNAVKEVNDALCIIKYDTNVDQNTLNYLNIQKNDYQNMLSKYSRGVVSYPELLSEEERLINIEQNRAQTKATRIVNYFTLYKAVGGKL